MVSAALTRPLRTETEATEAAMDRLIASAEWLITGATVTAASLDHGARDEALAFAALVEDALGETLKAWKLDHANARDDAEPVGRPVQWAR